MLEAQLLMPVLSHSQSIILCCKDGFPSCATPWSHQILESAELFSGVPGGKVCFSWREYVLGVIFIHNFPLPCGFVSGWELFCQYKLVDLWDTELAKAFPSGEELKWHLHWCLSQKKGTKRRTGDSYSGLKSCMQKYWGLVYAVTANFSFPCLIPLICYCTDQHRLVTGLEQSAHSTVLYLNPSVQGFVTQPRKSHLG